MSSNRVDVHIEVASLAPVVAPKTKYIAFVEPQVHEVRKFVSVTAVLRM